MDIQSEKLKLILWLTQLNDVAVIAKLKALKNEQTDWWRELSPEEKQEIEQGLTEADADMLSDNETVKSRLRPHT